MWSRWLLILIAILTLTSTANAIDVRKYRDDTYEGYVYEFPSSVFENLPPMPSNLFEVAEKYKYAKITARVLTEDYYLQPEFYPSWFLTANKTFKREPRLHGVAGYGIYPSTMDIYIKDEKEFRVYAIMHASWGVEVYQGVMVKPIYDKEKFDVKVIEPGECVLLPPTYPNFSMGWAKKLVLEIKIKKPLYHEEEILIKDAIPPEDIDRAWREQYGSKYRSGGSILELQQPRLRIKIIPLYVNSTTSPFGEIGKLNKLTYVLLPIIVIIVLIIVLITIKKIKRKDDTLL